MDAATRGRFITFEGPDGSGKTTAARHLAEWLRARGVDAVLTGEPGGTPLGDEIRRIVLHHRGVADDLDPRADALLFAAQRAQHVARLIRPAMEHGAWVVCARFLDSSLAYQGAGYGINEDAMRQLQAFATDELVPDLTVLIDVPVEIGLGRKRRGQWNRFEDTEGAAFFSAVRAAYLRLAAADPQRFRVIDGSGTVPEVDEAVQALIEPLLAGAIP
jgi:dTMP kinase